MSDTRRQSVRRPSALVSVLGLALFPGAGIWNSDCVALGAETKQPPPVLAAVGPVHVLLLLPARFHLGPPRRLLRDGDGGSAVPARRGPP